MLVKHARLGEKGFELRDGLVVRSRGVGRGVTLVIPEDEELRTLLLRQHHDMPHAGHLGVYRMVGTMSTRFYWRGLYADCKKYCRQCPVC